MRTETDFLGTLEIPKDALYGIHSVRAKSNFSNHSQLSLEWYKAMGLVKQACYLAYEKFIQSASETFDIQQLHIKVISADKLSALLQAAVEVSNGNHFDHFIVPAIQGGAGTSININVNEIITNRALQIVGHQPGEYTILDPFEDANVYQSTNDVVPTALHIAAMRLLTDLEDNINHLRQEIEAKEQQYRNILRQGYTQMQEAVPSSYDKLFSTYNNALSRDWWRVSKCFERIKEINLGGGAIGTGLSIPRFFIMEATQQLQRLSGLPVAKAENLSDATANLDVWVEVHATLKAHAVNLEKMVSDLRLLSSDLFKNRELQIPQQQVGSTIMPGKVNPVIPEFVVSASHQIYANDMIVTSLSAQGVLDLNAYLPIIGHSLLNSLELLIAVNQSLLNNLWKNMVIHPLEKETIFLSPSISTALTPIIGYHQATLLALEMKKNNISIFEANNKLNIISDEKLRYHLQPDKLVQLGYSLHDFIPKKNFTPLIDK